MGEDEYQIFGDGSKATKVGGGNDTNMPTSAGDRVVFLPEWEGMTLVFDAESGQVLQRNLTEPLLGTSAYHQGTRTWLRGISHLYCVGK